MRVLKIPEAYKPGLANIRSLSDDLFGSLLTTLEKCPPMAISAKDISNYASSAIPGIAEDNLEDILNALFSLYYVRADAGILAQELASDVKKAMLDTSGLKLSEEESIKFVDRLARLLSIESLSCASKAERLRGDFANLFCDAKILTDIRPVFGKPEERPVAAIITQTLVLKYHEGVGAHKELYVALDSDDIAALKEVLERAESKAASLKALLQNSKIPDLGSKP